MKTAIEAGMVLCSANTLKPADMQLPGATMVETSTAENKDSFSLEQTERNAIIRALKQAGGVQKEAAKLLGISRRAIHYKIKKYEIDSSGMRARHLG